MANPLATLASELYNKYEEKLIVNPDLSRKLVSFQANKKLPFYSWYKYKEGFAKPLVDYCLDDSNSSAMVLDPFAGSGAALFAANQRGISATGIELLPSGIFPIQCRVDAQKVDSEVFSSLVKNVLSIPSYSIYKTTDFKHIRITKDAFSKQTEQELMGYTGYVESLDVDEHCKNLLKFGAISVLEQISYTRKDGQFLRWDGRSGRKSKFNKGHIPTFKEAITAKLNQFSKDILEANKNGIADINLLQGSCLEKLFEINEDSIGTIITSPPYCNRLDYTRTYPLELVYLGSNSEDVKRLRQTMLSCTVENTSKVEALEGFYTDKKSSDSFERSVEIFESQEVLSSILSSLEEVKEQLPNKSIIRMIRNYFFEMNLVISHCYRVLEPGGKMYMVNDNVQYTGIEVPVDLILSDFASKYGFEIEKIWVLPRGKGNASQQMGIHGRKEIRKCVYVWKKQ